MRPTRWRFRRTGSSCRRAILLRLYPLDKVLSLWDHGAHLISLAEIMERLQIESYINLVRILEYSFAIMKQHKGLVVPVAIIKTMEEHFETIINHLEAIHLTQSSILGKRIHETLLSGDNIQASELEHSLQELQSRITDELSSQFFAYISPDRAKYYDSTSPLFGKQVQKYFTSSNMIFDIEEAGKCFAVGRYTACIFHLMRILEGGMAVLSKGLGIPDPVREAERNWGKTLDKIKKTIDEKDKIADPQWQEMKDFYHRCYGMLESVRHAWRNTTMHVGEKYTPDEAEDIFNSVKGFMRQLATKLNESGKRI